MLSYICTTGGHMNKSSITYPNLSGQTSRVMVVFMWLTLSMFSFHITIIPLLNSDVMTVAYGGEEQEEESKGQKNTQPIAEEDKCLSHEAGYDFYKFQSFTRANAICIAHNSTILDVETPPPDFLS